MQHKKVCKGCNNVYRTEDKRRKYCSKKCFFRNFPSNKINVKCTYCGRVVEIFPSRLDGRHHFCDVSCQTNWQKTTKLPSIGEKLLGKVCWICRRTYKPKRRTAKYCSNNCRLTNLNEYPYGENNPAWRGGVVTGRRKLESTKTYKQWRKDVFKRDRYKCLLCGSTSNICAHHIKPLSLYPELGTILSNGATLCSKCHLKTYGKEKDFECVIHNTLYLLADLHILKPRIFIDNTYSDIVYEVAGG